MKELTITITGEAGAGKSTIAAYIAHCLEKGQPDIDLTFNDEVTPEHGGFVSDRRLRRLPKLFPMLISINVSERLQQKEDA